MSDDIRDAVARALWDTSAGFGEKPKAWDDADPVSRKYYCALADAAILALRPAPAPNNSRIDGEEWHSRELP